MGRTARRSLFRELGGRGRGKTDISKVERLQRRLRDVEGSVNEKNIRQAARLRAELAKEQMKSGVAGTFRPGQARPGTGLTVKEAERKGKVERRRAEVAAQKETERLRKEAIKADTQRRIREEAARRGVPPETLGFELKTGRIVPIPRREAPTKVEKAVFTQQVAQLPPKEKPIRQLEPTITPISEGLAGQFREEQLEEAKKRKGVTIFQAIAQKTTKPAFKFFEGTIFTPEKIGKGVEKTTFELLRPKQKGLRGVFRAGVELSKPKEERFKEVETTTIRPESPTVEKVAQFTGGVVKGTLETIRDEPQLVALDVAGGAAFTKVVRPGAAIVSGKAIVKKAPKVTSALTEKAIRLREKAGKAFQYLAGGAYVATTAIEGERAAARAEPSERVRARGEAYGRSGVFGAAFVVGGAAGMRSTRFKGIEREAARTELEVVATGNIEAQKVLRQTLPIERELSGKTFRPEDIKEFDPGIVRGISPRKTTRVGRVLVEEDVILKGSAGQAIFPVKFVDPKRAVLTKQGLAGPPKTPGDIDVGARRVSVVSEKLQKITGQEADVKPIRETIYDPLARPKIRVKVKGQQETIRAVGPGEQLSRKQRGIFDVQERGEGVKPGTGRARKDIPDFIQLSKGLAKKGVDEVPGRRAFFEKPLTPKRRKELSKRIEKLEKSLERGKIKKPEEQLAVGIDKAPARFTFEFKGFSKGKKPSRSIIPSPRVSTALPSPSVAPSPSLVKSPSVVSPSRIPSPSVAPSPSITPSPSVPPSPSSPISPSIIPSPYLPPSFSQPSPSISKPISITPTKPIVGKPLAPFAGLFGAARPKKGRVKKPKRKLRPSLIGIAAGVKRKDLGLTSKQVLSGFEVRGV